MKRGRRSNLCCCDITNGGYKPHCPDEYVCVEDSVAGYKLILDLCRSLDARRAYRTALIDRRNVMATAETLVQVLAEKNMTCATAESCTGGGVGYTITGVSGSSAVFWGGVISYDNSVKRDVLGVPEEVLATKGAVSSECAAAMAEGARRLMKTDLAVSLTGIAGPGGGSAEKPVGLVWFGVASESGTITEKKIFPGDRESVRTAAIEHALHLLLNAAGGLGIVENDSCMG